MAAAAVSHLFCFIYSLPVSPLFHIQNFTLTLYPINKNLCHKIDPYRDVVFHLYTRFNPTTSQIIQIGNDSLLQDSYLNFSNPTVLFFHGFTESLHADDSQLLRRSFLRRGDYNVIVTNADRLLAGLYYLESVKNCRYIGQYGAQLVDYLVTRGLRLATLHVIGMSLGAQIAGFVGQYVTSGRLPRITGLDPAGPLYHKASLDDRLDPSDADFVDVIHTNQAVFGIVQSIGHVDFWPNGGGPKQPGCSFYERFVRSGFSLVELVFCEHYRSYRLFAKSLTDPYRYRAKQCTSYGDYKNGKCNSNQEIYMGISADITARGDFYIYTGTDANGYDS